MKRAVLLLLLLAACKEKPRGDFRRGAAKVPQPNPPAGWVSECPGRRESIALFDGGVATCCLGDAGVYNCLPIEMDWEE